MLESSFAFKGCELSCSRPLRVVEHSQMENIIPQSLTRGFPINFLPAELAFCISNTSGGRSCALLGEILFLERCHQDLWTCSVPLPLAHLASSWPTDIKRSWLLEQPPAAHPPSLSQNQHESVSI